MIRLDILSLSTCRKDVCYHGTLAEFSPIHPTNTENIPRNPTVARDGELLRLLISAQPNIEADTHDQQHNREREAG